MANHRRQASNGTQSTEATMDRIYGPVILTLSMVPFVRLDAGFQSSEKVGRFLGVTVDWDIHSCLEGLGNICVHQDDYFIVESSGSRR